MNKVAVYADTPNGKKLHGFAYKKERIFERNVTYKDMMHMYKAWSLNPEVLKKIVSKGYKLIRFVVTNAMDEVKVLTIPVEKAVDKGFQRSHGGGDTFYIEEKHFDHEQKENKSTK